MWQLTSRWVSELQPLIRVLGFMSVISVDSHQYLNAILPWVFLQSFLSNHRDGLVLMSRCTLSLLYWQEQKTACGFWALQWQIPACWGNILLAVCCQSRLTSFAGWLGCCLLQGADSGVWVTCFPEPFVPLTNWVVHWWNCTTSFCMLDKLHFLGCSLSTLTLFNSTKQQEETQTCWEEITC